MERTRSLRLFVLVGAAFALPAVLAIAVMEKFALHAAINAHHAHWADLFFRVVTHFGDGIVPTLLALLLLFTKDLRSFLMMALTSGLSAIVAQVLKRQVFADQHRPGRFTEELEGIYWVEGIDLHHHFSFPSGHATAAFAMCIALAVVLARPKWGALLAVVASVLAFSRVYLSQHFTEDIVAGAALGTLTGVLVHHLLYRSTFSRKAWLDRRMVQRLK